MNSALMKEWAEAHGLRKSDRGYCLHWLAKGRCGVSVCREAVNEHRWMDHTTAWIDKDGKSMLLCQPYHLDLSEMRDLDDVAKRFGFSITVHGAGWYGYGTIAIELRKVDPREKQ